MGYRPTLDGLRAVAVIAVILYHAKFNWIRGGFIGVEVFFVVSGFLITSLLIEEREKNGSISLKHFWIRRARRLLPALLTMLLAVSVWTLLFAKPMGSQLRHDIVPALTYISNWWQIFFTNVPYFSPKDPPLLRHLWSLAVEEQWYLLWPIAFTVLAIRSQNALRAARTLFYAAAGIVLITAVLYSRGDEGRVNFLYLSTFSRASGLLLGAAGAFVWRPWRTQQSNDKKTIATIPNYVLTLGAVISGALIIALALTLTVEGAFLYQGGLALVSLASLVLVVCAVHPNAYILQKVLGFPWLVELGKRSYGLYLWHWPIFLFCDARNSVPRFVQAIVVAVVLSEVCYRYIETPIRTGVFIHWIGHLRRSTGQEHRDYVITAGSYLLAAVVLVISVTVGLSAAKPFDPSVDTSTGVQFVAPTSTPTTSAAVSTTVSAITTTTTTIPPTLPRRLVIVGDSQAHALAINLPDGIESTFTITDGSIDGCGVYEVGVGISARPGFRRAFKGCAGWEQKWAKSASRANAEVALVVLGAWEVLDVENGEQITTVGSPSGDQLFLGQVQKGIDALTATGAQVAVLEVPCMRPVESKGAGVPPLPERADDTRTQHLSDLLRSLADKNFTTTTFIEGPKAWCNDPTIAQSLAYRWDGVHVYKPGAKLIYETIAPALLAVKVPA